MWYSSPCVSMNVELCAGSLFIKLIAGVLNTWISWKDSCKHCEPQKILEVLILKLNCVFFPHVSQWQSPIGGWSICTFWTPLLKSLFCAFPSFNPILLLTQRVRQEPLMVVLWLDEHAQLMAVYKSSHCLYHVKDRLKIVGLYWAVVWGHSLLEWSSRITSFCRQRNRQKHLTFLLLLLETHLSVPNIKVYASAASTATYTSLMEWFGEKEFLVTTSGNVVFPLSLNGIYPLCSRPSQAGFSSTQGIYL